MPGGGGRGRTVALGGAALLCALAAGCASRDPVVNRLNVDDARYNRDLAECQRRSSGVPLLGNSVGDCLKGKGYQVLMSR